MATIKDLRGREIIVNVGHGERDRSGPTSAKRKGSPQTTNKRDGIFHRRTKAGKIQFYDLGFQKGEDGVFRTIGYRQVPDWIFAGSSVTVRNMELNDYVVRDAAVFAGLPADPKDWKAKVKKIAKGSASQQYRLTISGANYSGTLLDDLPPDVWTDAGLVLSGDDLATLNIDEDTAVGAATGVLLYTDANQKVTAVRNFSAPAVPFSPGGQMDVFLMPGIHFVEGRSNASIAIIVIPPGPGGYERFVTTRADFFWTLKPREQFTDPTHPYYGQATSGNFSQGTFEGGPVNYGQAWTAKDYLNSLAHRAVTYDDYLHAWNDSSFPVGPFTVPPTMPPNMAGNKVGELRVNWLIQQPGQNGFRDGVLLAVVLKGNSTFYIWAKD